MTTSDQAGSGRYPQDVETDQDSFVRRAKEARFLEGHRFCENASDSELANASTEDLRHLAYGVKHPRAQYFLAIKYLDRSLIDTVDRREATELLGMAAEHVPAAAEALTKLRCEERAERILKEELARNQKETERSSTALAIVLMVLGFLIMFASPVAGMLVFLVGILSPLFFTR